MMGHVVDDVIGGRLTVLGSHRDPCVLINACQTQRCFAALPRGNAATQTIINAATYATSNGAHATFPVRPTSTNSAAVRPTLVSCPIMSLTNAPPALRVGRNTARVIYNCATNPMAPPAKAE